MTTIVPGKPSDGGFRRREWIMVLIIIAFIEGAIFISANSAKNNQEVINYISFASTIASLLLAILAIVYAFFQSESQKKAGEGVADHLSTLRVATEDMRRVSAELSESASGVSEMSLDLKNLDLAIKSTHEKLQNLEGGVAGVSQRQDEVNQTLQTIFSSKSTSKIDGTEFQTSINAAEAVLFNNSSFPVDIVAYALYATFKDKKDQIIDINDFVTPISEKLGEEKNMHMDSQDWMKFIVLLISIFGSVNILCENTKNDGRFDSFFVPKESWKVLVKSAEISLSNKKLRKITCVIDEVAKQIRQDLKPASSPA